MPEFPYDAHNCIRGRKRHLLVDTLGLPVAWYVTPADLSDPQGARRLLGGLAYFVPRLKKIWADAAYRGKELAEWCLQQGDGWDLEIMEREPGTRGFQVQPRRWVVERSFAWLSGNRRLARDYERTVQTSETLIEVAGTRLLLRRLAPGSRGNAPLRASIRFADRVRSRARPTPSPRLPHLRAFSGRLDERSDGQGLRHIDGVAAPGFNDR